MEPSAGKFMRAFGLRLMWGLVAALAVSAAASAAQSVSKQTSFASPEEAVMALVAAVKADDTKTMIQIFGSDMLSVLESGDSVADRADRERFVTAYEEANNLEKSGDSSVVLGVGNDDWRFPIPLVKVAGGWHFDATAGKEELLNRRIGRNELSAIQAIQAYVDAQHEYYLANPQRDMLFGYAQKFLSAPGKRDGLYYPIKEGEPLSPLGATYANARAAGYGGGTNNQESAPQAYYGYFYRILKEQGPEAPGGAYEYVVQGKMIGGHALIAWPASYGNSGVMTFITNHDGVVYENDLGPNTTAAAEKITKFNPDKMWKPVKDGS